MSPLYMHRIRVLAGLAFEIGAVLTFADLGRLGRVPGWLAMLWIAITLTQYALLRWD